MTSNLAELQQRRAQILDEIATIDCLRRGHLSEQFFKFTRDGKTSCRVGPYSVLQRWGQGKNLCERVPADQVEPVRQGVAGYQRFGAPGRGVRRRLRTDHALGRSPPAVKNGSRGPLRSGFRETTEVLLMGPRTVSDRGTAVMGCWSRARDLIEGEDGRRCLRRCSTTPPCRCPTTRPDREHRHARRLNNGGEPVRPAGAAAQLRHRPRPVRRSRPLDQSLGRGRLHSRLGATPVLASGAGSCLRMPAKACARCGHSN